MIDPTIQRYIAEQRAAGLGDTAIKAALEQSGWDAAVVEQAFGTAVTATGLSLSAIVVTVVIITTLVGGGYGAYRWWGNSVSSVKTTYPEQPTNKVSGDNSTIGGVDVVRSFRALSEKFTSAQFRVQLEGYANVLYHKGSIYATKSKDINHYAASESYLDDDKKTYTSCYPRNKACSPTKQLSQDEVNYNVSGILATYSVRKIFEDFSGLIFYALTTDQRSAGGVGALSTDQIYQYIERFNNEGVLRITQAADMTIIGYATSCFELNGADFHKLYCLEKQTGVPLYIESNNGHTVTQAVDFSTTVSATEIAPPIGYTNR